ncbi:MAG: TonB-dependent receptor [Agriterribacter sp.]
MRQRLLWLMVLLLPLTLRLSAQTQKNVTGTIKDANGNALAGATIAVKGTSRNSTSDANGIFSISVMDNKSVLVISYVGFAMQEILVGDQTSVNVVLLPSQGGDLAQVVVVGYGTQNKKDVTGAVKSVRAEAFNRGIVNTPQQLLQGKVAGVNVTSASGEPGGIQGITIRGAGSIRSGSTPLYVIDGLPLDNASTGGGDPLNFINPQDIASMDVLKDASATAIYGSRGANGVILITTKKGKAGTSNLTFNSSAGLSTLARKIPVFGTDEFKKQVVAVGGVLDDQGGSTDWQKVITRTAHTYDNNLTLSGGSDKLVYFASLNSQVQEGILKGNTLKRYTGRFNASQKFWDDRLTIDLNLTASNTKNERPPIETLLGSALANNPTYPVYNADGSLAKYTNINNPLVSLGLSKDITTINRVIGNISPSLTIIKGLVYKLNLGIDNSSSTRDIESLPNEEPQQDGRLDTYYTYNKNTLIENYLTYKTSFDKHNFTFLAGHSFQKIFVQGRNMSINKFPINGLDPIYNPGTGQELTLVNNKPGGYAYINELQSYFGRINYQYANKYMAEVIFRADGSTKFGANNKYGYFPSFSLGWLISEESFMQNSAFSYLKLRGGWGLTGNQEIGSKLTQALYTSTISGTTSYPLYPTGDYPAGTTYVRFANPDLKWEVSRQTNIGLDFAFLGGALSGAIDVFNKTSSNILLSLPPTDPVQPAGTLYANVKNMKISNSGIEFDLDYKKRISKNVSFGVGGNFTYIKNKVTGSPYSVIVSGSATGSGLTSAAVNGYINGYPIGSFYLKEFIGIGSDSTSEFRDVDKDGIITDKDRIVAGSALPKQLFSFYGNISFKGFDLIANFNGVSGNKIYDNTANAFFYKAKIAKSVNTTSAAVEYPKESINNPASISTRYLKDGGYLRLNSLVLGYSFNTESFGIKKWISTLRLSVTAQNLFVITKYNGYDPEINTDRQVDGVSSYGIDYLAYPKARSVIFGLNLSF